MRTLANLTVALALPLAAAHARQTCPVWNMGPDAAPNDTVRQLVVWRRSPTAQSGPALSRIVARGQFTTAGGIPAGGVALYDGGAWTPMSADWPYGNTGSGANCLAVLKEKVYAPAGTLSNNPATNAGRVWDGEAWINWTGLGTLGDNGGHTIAAVSLGDRLIVEGDFSFPHTNPNLVRGRRLALFTGISWFPLSESEYGPNTDQLNNFVTMNAVARLDGTIYIAGTFSRIAHGDSYNTSTELCGCICSYDGTSFHTLPHGGLNGSVTSMTLFDGRLIVAGTFTATADEAVQLNHIAAFDGSAWSRLGGGVSHNVDALVVADDGTGEKLHIFAGNQPTQTAWNTFPTSTDLVNFRGVVRWNGARYSSYGATLSSGLNAGAAYSAVRFDPGNGEGVYVGGTPFYGGPTPATRTFASWGPGPMPDTDGDGIADAWEQNGIDADCNGTVDLNLPAMGADWRHKDLYVEIDSMLGRRPAQRALDALVASFAAAPNTLVSNPDNQSGITLHLVVDDADQFLPLADFSFAYPWSDFHSYKSQWFGSPAERLDVNRRAILDAKRRVFRYCVFANRFDPLGSSGVAELPGNDFMVTLGAFRVPGGTPAEQASTFMHELGHTLGLNHGGHQVDASFDRRYNYKPNYHSVMNYAWQLDFRPGWRLDYSRSALPDLNEAHLDEVTGIGGAPGAVALIGPLPAATALETGAIDWNRNGSTPDFPVATDINHVRSNDLPSPGDVLQGSEDWSRLLFNFRNTADYSSGASPESTLGADDLNQTLADFIRSIYIPPCPADLGMTGGVPGQDGLLNNNDFVVFIDYFFAGELEADIGSTGGVPGPDGQFNNNDFVVFIDRFFAGC